MKKIFLAALMLFTVGGIISAQTTPAKTNASQKKEAVKKEVKPASTVSSVTPVNSTKKTSSGTKTEKKPVAKTNAKPAATPAVSSSTIGKHKKHHPATKKHRPATKKQ